MAADPNFEVMGQKIVLPSHWPGMVSLTLMVAGAVLMVYFVTSTVRRAIELNPRLSGQIVSAFTYTEYEAGQHGKAKGRVDDDNKLFQFYTPSADTQVDLAQASVTGQVPDASKWEITTEQNVSQFEDKLWHRFHNEITGGPLHGMRRYQQVGRGTSGKPKRGWWWILNVDQDFDSEEFAKFYFASWPGSPHVYIEEINGRTGYK